MTDDINRRVRRLTERARTETVTEELLVGGNEYTGEFLLYDEPPIAHLEPDEQPHAILFNDLKGVGIDSKRNTVTPDGSASSVFIVTDRRLLMLVGQRDGDWVRTCSLDAITGGAYHTGLMKHRVVVYTQDQTYHLWVDASYRGPALDATVALLEAAATTDGPNASNAEETQTAIGDGTGLEPPIAAGDTTEANDDGGTDRTDDDGADPTSDPLATIERLNELNETGVITDEEFQTKKSELLDQI